VSLYRFAAKKIELGLAQSIISAEVKRIVESAQPIEVILIGSGARNELTDCSDLDFIVLFDSELKMDLGKKSYYLTKSLSSTAVDVLFMTESEYRSRSQMGGVCFVARKEGVCVFSQKSATEVNL
jgi:predicted nucleotidyltransferase